MSEIDKSGYFQKGMYKVPITINTKIFEELGRVKRKNDGRWEFWRWNSTFHKTWQGNTQGVKETEEEAIKAVLGGWK